MAGICWPRVTMGPPAAKVMNRPEEDRHAVALCHVFWIDRRFVSRGGHRRGAARRRRIVHVAGLFVLPTCERVPERVVEGSARCAGARLPRHLLGSAGLEGSVLVAGGDTAAGPVWSPLRRW